MPLHQIIHHNETTQIYIWKITESLDQLTSEVTLHEKSQLRVKSMKSELHRRGFLSVRKLLEHCGYTDFDLYYDQFGKPNLHDGRQISITHSHEFSAIVLSDSDMGIDLEKRREKIKIIANKFTAPTEELYLDTKSADYISKLTVIWGAKESIFKIRNEIGISFKDHVAILPFEISDGKATAILTFNEVETNFKIYFQEIENFMLVYAVTF